jgi:hypothetical protein
MSQRAMSWMPKGTLPPMIMRTDAGSLPVGYLVLLPDRLPDSPRPAEPPRTHCPNFRDHYNVKRIELGTLRGLTPFWKATFSIATASC